MENPLLLAACWARRDSSDDLHYARVSQSKWFRSLHQKPKADDVCTSGLSDTALPMKLYKFPESTTQMATSTTPLFGSNTKR